MKTKIINTPDMLKAASRKKSATVFMPATFDKKDQLEALVKVRNTIFIPMAAKLMFVMKKRCVAY